MNETKLRDVAHIISGQHLLESEHNLDRKGIGYLTGPADFGPLQPTISRWTECPKVVCEPGDILVTVKGAGVGKINMSPNTTVAIGRQLMAVRSNSARLDSGFLFSYLIAQLAYFQERAVGATVPGLSRGDLEDIVIRLPSLTAQRQIAVRLKAQLAEVATARQAVLQQRRELDALIAAVYRETFRDIVPVTEPKSIEPAPAGWAWHKLNNLARLESGHTPSRSRPEWWGGDISWVSLTEIRALDGQWTESTQLRTNEAGIANSSARLLPRGTVCFSRTASVGFVTIMAKPMATSQDFANWVCGSDLDPEYLMYALIRSRTELRGIATGATHKTIYMPALESFSTLCPSA